MNYTINNVMPTGKESPMYGTEYYIKFNESPDTATLWYKTKPEVGQSQPGEFIDGKFKKEKKEWNPGQAPATQASKAPYVRKDNSDGMRIGMCINNAANYVNLKLNSKNEVVSPEEWATLVSTHAKALYAKSDLSIQSEEIPEEDIPTINVDQVKTVFGL